MSETPRNQIRLQAITGSLSDISTIANQSLADADRLQPAGADQIAASSLEGILGQLAASVKRIQGDSGKDFTEVAAGVFKHAESVFSGSISITDDLQVKGNDIKDGNGDVVITMSGDGNKLTTLAGDLKVAGDTIKSSTADALQLDGANVEVKGDLQITGNDIKASDGAATISMSARDVTIAGDLQVSGNDIKASDGVTTITMSARDVIIAGDLQVSGNDIKASDGITTISMSGRNITVAGDLAVNGGDLTTSQTTASLFNATATTVNIAAGATSGVNIGNAASDVTLAGDLRVNGNDIKASDGIATISMSARDVTIAGDLQVSGNDIKSSAGTAVITLANNDAIFADRVDIVGDAAVSGSLTSLGVISGSSHLLIGGNITGSNMVLYGDLALNGGDITTTQSVASIFDTTATTILIGNDATLIELGAAAGIVDIAGDLKVSGNDIKDSGSNTRISMFDGVAVLSTVNASYAAEETSVSYGGDQGTITLPASWTSVDISLVATEFDRTFAVPSLSSDSSSIVATVSWSGTTYTGGQSIVVPRHATGTITFAGGGTFSNGSVTVTSSAPTVNPTVEISADLRVKGNDIKDSRNDVMVSFSGDGQKLTTLAGDVKIVGNSIRSSDGLVTMEMSGRDVMVSGSMSLSGSELAFVGAANSDASIKLKTGGDFSIRGGVLSNGQPVVGLELTGSAMGFVDGYMIGNWTRPTLSLADSAADWQSFKNAFGEVSLLNAIKSAAGGFGDGVHLFKATGSISANTPVQSTSIVRQQGTHFGTSFTATDVSTRNENIKLYLNGQLLISKSFDATNYDYDVFGDGSTVSFNFELQQDDTIVAIVPMAVASTDDYVSTIGYDLCGTVDGKPASSEVVFKLVMPRDALFNSGYAYADVAPVSSLTLQIQRGVASGGSISYSQVGSITFSPGSATGVVSWTGGYVTINRTEVVRIVAPAVVDATFSSPVFTLIGVEA